MKLAFWPGRRTIKKNMLKNTFQVGRLASLEKHKASLKKFWADKIQFSK